MQMSKHGNGRVFLQSELYHSEDLAQQEGKGWDSCQFHANFLDLCTLRFHWVADRKRSISLEDKGQHLSSSAGAWKVRPCFQERQDPLSNFRAGFPQRNDFLRNTDSFLKSKARGTFLFFPPLS